jgi:hypothetical protein
VKKEIINKLNYLNITKHNQLTFEIYRKPTTADLIIHNDSCHTYEHRKPAINYLIHKMNTCPVTSKTKARN